MPVTRLVSRTGVPLFPGHHRETALASRQIPPRGVLLPLLLPGRVRPQGKAHFPPNQEFRLAIRFSFGKTVLRRKTSKVKGETGMALLPTF